MLALRKGKDEIKLESLNFTIALLPMRFGLLLLRKGAFVNAIHQLITYPALGLCGIDEAHRFVDRGDNTVSRFHGVLLLAQ